MKKRIIGFITALLLFPALVWAEPSVTVTRISGSNRFQTAVKIARTSYETAETIVIAGAEKPVDAMTGGVLAAAAKAPLLLVGKNSMDSGVRAAIADYAPKKIYVLGGTQAVSTSVEKMLEQYAPVTRLSGKNRYGTAAAAEKEAQKFGAKRGGAVVVNAEDLADSLIAGPFVAKRNGVMLLFTGNEVKSDLTVVGGEVQIPRYKGKNRIAGKNRFETAIAVARQGFADSKTAILVSDQTPTDALAAISLSKKYGAPILYMKKEGVPSSVREYLKACGVTQIFLVGGENSISPIGEASVKNLYIRANELGSVPILMYHQIDTTGSGYSRSPEEFYNDLDALYHSGYLPVLLSDYIEGNMNLPAGYKPYILTFDDGAADNFRFNNDRTVDRTSAVGVLMSFAEDHPLFRPHATFFITGEVPFHVESEVEEKMKFLYENGMEIGNHSVSHAHFWTLDEEGLQYEIGEQYNRLNAYRNIPRPVNLLCLPFGEWPRAAYLDYLVQGSWDGIPYESAGVIYVGERNAYSPYHIRFNPYVIRRKGIGNPYGRSAKDIIAYYDANPDEKYVSDGDPNTIGIPANWQDVLGAVPAGKSVQLYPDYP